MKSLPKRMSQARDSDTWLASLMLLLLAILLSFFPSNFDLSSWIPDSSQAEQLEVDSERNLPIFFEEHLKEAGSGAFYVARGINYTAVLTGEGITLGFPRREGSKTLRMVLESADPEVQLSGQGALPGKTNYLVGNDSDRWLTDISNFAKVHYREVYPAIDLVFYSNGQRLEYDFVVKPGGDPEAIQFRFEGADEFEIDSRGNLRLATGEEELEILSPYIYQEVAGSLHAVAGEYEFGDDGSVGFRVDDYDSSQPLIIDPVLVYSTMLGGGFPDNGRAVAVDAAGNGYFGGVTGNGGIKFPTINALQDMQAGSDDAFVTKFDPQGNVLFSTIFGGAEETTCLVWSSTRIPTS